ncbi:MAG: hypothetical protein IPI67_17615 [Myxococcales bacterium]|nr:hypothetical protein [Myxococcales bacterium]
MQHRSQLVRTNFIIVSYWLAVGCGGAAAPEPAAPAATAAPSAPAAPAETPAPTAEAPPSAAAVPPPAMPTQGEPANHFLDAETWFTSNAGYDANLIYADPAKQLTPPGQDGNAKFWSFFSKKETTSQHFWKTRAAKKEELAVGQLALMLNKKNGEGVYVAPSSVKEAYSLRWWITRIVSVRPLAEGFVLLAGNYRAAPDAIRVLEGDTSPSIEKQGKEDAHFLAEEHWFAGRSELPKKNHAYVDPAVPAKPAAPMEGGEGRFVLTTSGKILLTSHAWQTRIAKRADLKKGQLVFAPDIKSGNKYRAPKSRAESLAARWFAVRVETLDKDSVTVEGNYQVAPDALRVAK